MLDNPFQSWEYFHLPPIVREELLIAFYCVSFRIESRVIRLHT